jgi:hypothetical protein
MPLDDGLVLADERLPVGGRDVGVEGVALAVLVDLEHLLEMVVVDLEHHVRIHGDEAPVAVIGEALVARRLGQRLDGGVVEAEVEDRVHHARHGGAGARAHGNEKRVGRIAEAALRQPPDRGERLAHLPLELGRVGLAMVVVIGADLGRDRESRRDGKPEVGHLGEVRALAAEQIAHAGLALGLTVAEGVHPLRHRCPQMLSRSAARRRLMAWPMPSRFATALEQPSSRRPSGLSQNAVRAPLRRNRLGHQAGIGNQP